MFAGMLTEDDPRLAKFPPATRRQIVRQMNGQAKKRDPDVMIEESCAITTRVAPSFTRVGHVDLFARRAIRAGKNSDAHAELEMIVRHAIFREFPEVWKSIVTLVPIRPRSRGARRSLRTLPGASLRPPLAFNPRPRRLSTPPDAFQLHQVWKTIEDAPGVPPEAAAAFLRASARALATMVAGWLRVGFCQGNFNADNCLVGGRTMDYGPFGFVDKARSILSSRLTWRLMSPR
jgi:uncharacterized protein YdiU (UPF0061 family)